MEHRHLHCLHDKRRPGAICNADVVTVVAYAWVSQVAHSGEEHMQVYIFCFVLFLLYVI